MLTFPSQLPTRPLIDGFRYLPVPNHRDSEVEDGPGRRVRRSTARTALYEMSFTYQQEHCRILRQFYEDNLDDGVRMFIFPRDPVWKDEMRARFEGKFALVPTEALIEEDMPVWRCTFVLRRMP